MGRGLADTGLEGMELVESARSVEANGHVLIRCIPLDYTYCIALAFVHKA